jgi:CelD/BcsL family acetyltransferase involved in cellulose biosynthesis
MQDINMPLELEELTSAGELAALEPDWRALWHCDPCATPFQSPDWLLPWTKRLWGGGRLRILAARRDGELAGVAPFFQWGHDVIRLSFLGSGISDYLGTIAKPDAGCEFASLVLQWLAGTQNEWQVCDLQELRPCAPLLRADVPAGLTSRSTPLSVCPVVALPPAMDDLRAGLSTKFRRNLDRARTMLEKQGRVEFVRATAANVAEIMQSLFRLHEARWTERCGHGMFHTEPLQAFHLEAAERFERCGVLRLFALRVNGETIAVQYSLGAKDRAYSYLGGFDTAWGRFSPGAVLLEHAIRCAIDEQAKELDFLRNSEAYKYLWGARDHVSRKLLIWPQAFAERVA